MKIQKKLFPLLICIIICLMSFAPAFAAQGTQYITDERGVLGVYESNLNERASTIFDNFKFNTCVYICTENYTENLNIYAEKLYKDSFAGGDGLMFVENGKQCGFFASGKASQIFGETQFSELLEKYNEGKTYREKVFMLLEKAEQILYSSGLYNVDTKNHPPRVVDNAGLLSKTQREELSQRLDKISKDQECDVVLVTTDSIGNKSSQAYADDFYDYNGYGTGQGDDGILFLVSMEDRDYAFTTYGFGVKAFNDKGLEKLEDDILPLLGDGEYYDAFSTYADSSERLLIMANEGAPYGVDGNVDKPSTEDIVATGVPGAAIVGIGGSGVATLVKKSKLKTVRRRYGAGDYVVPGSMVLDKSNEYYLYNQISKTARPKENSSGGSTMHTGSSGRSHGGSSGKF